MEYHGRKIEASGSLAGDAKSKKSSMRLSMLSICEYLDDDSFRFLPYATNAVVCL